MKTIYSQKDKWMLAEDIPDIDLFFAQIWLSAFANDLKRTVGRNYRRVMCVFTGTNIKFYYGAKDSAAFSAHVFGLVQSNPSFGEKINQEIIRLTDKLVRFAEQVRLQNLKKLTNKELWYLWQYHDAIHTELYTWGWLPNVTDMFHANFTHYLQAYFKRRGVSVDKVNEYLVTLTSPALPSVINQEREEFLSLALKLSAAKGIKKTLSVKPEIFIAKLRLEHRKLLETHWEKWHHLKYNFMGPEVTSFEEYARDLQDLLRSGTNPRSLLNQEIERRVLLAREQKRLLARIKPDAKHKLLFKLWGNFMLTKFYRRNGQIRTVAILLGLMKEVGRRLNLPLGHVRMMLNSEVEAGLIHGKVNHSELSRRVKSCVYYTEKGREVVYTGSRAQALAMQVPKVKAYNLVELKGQCGSVGKARGRVKLIFRPKDIPKMEAGDILVSIATDPDIVPAMKKAAAIVTEQGGVTSHAAIVARELGIPCLIGTKIATKVFKDGDLVEVDATKGVVRKIN